MGRPTSPLSAYSFAFDQFRTDQVGYVEVDVVMPAKEGGGRHAAWSRLSRAGHERLPCLCPSCGRRLFREWKVRVMCAGLLWPALVRAPPGRDQGVAGRDARGRALGGCRGLTLWWCQGVVEPLTEVERAWITTCLGTLCKRVFVSNVWCEVVTYTCIVLAGGRVGGAVGREGVGADGR